MSTVTAIQGVDEILYTLSNAAVASLNPKPDVTVGPLDGDETGLRLNWFLYRVSPDPTYRNMEPPNNGWRTARGNPPLALRLSYLLSAFPADAHGWRRPGAVRARRSRRRDAGGVRERGRG